MLCLGTHHVPVPDNNERFLAELEFVQCLAAPSYIHCKIMYDLKILIKINVLCICCIFI